MQISVGSPRTAFHNDVPHLFLLLMLFATPTRPRSSHFLRFLLMVASCYYTNRISFTRGQLEQMVGCIAN